MFPAVDGGQLKLLTQDEIKAIHDSSVRLLEEVGMKVASAEARRIFAENAAAVDEKTQIVRIPRKMIEKAIETAPSKVVLYAQDPKTIFIWKKRALISVQGERSSTRLTGKQGKKEKPSPRTFAISPEWWTTAIMSLFM